MLLNPLYTAPLPAGFTSGTVEIKSPGTYVDQAGRVQQPSYRFSINADGSLTSLQVGGASSIVGMGVGDRSNAPNVDVVIELRVAGSPVPFRTTYNMVPFDSGSGTLRLQQEKQTAPVIVTASVISNLSNQTALYVMGTENINIGGTSLAVETFQPVAPAATAASVTAAATAAVAPVKSAIGNLAITALAGKASADGPQFVDGYRWTSQATGAAIINGGTVVAGTGNIWVREFYGPVFPDWFKLAGATDDTACLIAAMTYYGDIKLLPRTYVISSPLPDPTNKRIQGIRTSSYIDFTLDFQQVNPSYYNRASIIQYGPSLHGSIFSGNAANRVSGMVLDGVCIRYGGIRTSVDRAFPTATAVDFSILNECKLENLEAFLTKLDASTGQITAKDSRFFQCGTIFEGVLVDCVMDGNVVASNICFFYSRGGGGLNQFNGNRIEFGTTGIQLYQSRDDTFTGNHFDGQQGPAVDIRQSTAQITGGLMWRNARVTPGAHIFIQDSDVKIAGVRFKRGVGDSDTAQTPSYAGAAGAFTGAGVKPFPLYLISVAGTGSLELDSATYNGYTDRLVYDASGASTLQVSLKDWHLPDASDLSSTDDMSASSAYLSGQTRTYLHRDLTIRNYYARLRKIDLLSFGGARIITNGAGIIGFNTMSGVTYGGLAYEVRNGQLYAPAQPNAYGTTGAFAIGDAVYLTTPAAGGMLGWVKTASGSPDIWKTFGPITA